MFSPDGNILASIGDDNNINGEEKVIFWDKKGNYLEDSQGKEVSFEYEDNTITSISEGSKCDTLIFWQLDGKNLKTPKKSEFCEEFSGILDYSSDRKTIAWGQTEYPLKLWSIDGDLIRTFKGHNAWVNSVSFSPDGTKIVSGSNDGTIKIWDKRNGSLINTIEEEDKVNTVSFSPDGTKIVSGSDNKTLKLWSLDGRLIHTFEGHTNTVEKATFSPDGKMMASVSDNNTVILWDVEKQKLKKRIENDDWDDVTNISFSAKSDILAIEDYNGKVTLRLLNGIFVKETKLYTTNSFFGEKFSLGGKAIAVQNQSGISLLNADLDDLLNRACNRARAYLKTTDDKSKRHLCD